MIFVRLGGNSMSDLNHLNVREDDAPIIRARSCRNVVSPQDAEREWIARMLWKAFPESRSENELADLVAAHFAGRGREVSARTVRYWLRRETTPHWRYVVELMALAGAERAFELIFGTGGSK